jgi:hypothetical protein
LKSKYLRKSNLSIAAATLLAVIQFYACGEKATPVGENLLANSSFEDVSDGIPKRWQINNFRGLQDMKASTYGVTDSLSYEGGRSFYFKAQANTRRFYVLSQEVRVSDVKRVRIRGAIKTNAVTKNDGQYPQANLALTFFNKNHERYESSRFADVRTNLNWGTTDGWLLADRIFRLPLGTEYIIVHCVLGTEGEIWFDDVSLEVPEDLPWQRVDGENFTHYWLDQPYPEGSTEFQQQLLDYYGTVLGIPKERRVHIDYYLHPDSASVRKTVGFGGHVYVDYKRRQIHSINPVDNHEIIHLLTDPYGTLPKALSEGTAFYLMDDFLGEPVQPLAQRLLLDGQLPGLRSALDPSAVRTGDPTKIIPATASFVGYLIELGGPAKFLELHGNTRVDHTYARFAEAFAAAYGKPLDQAEAAWRRTLARADFSQGEETGREE